MVYRKLDFLAGCENYYKNYFQQAIKIKCFLIISHACPFSDGKLHEKVHIWNKKLK